MAKLIVASVLLLTIVGGFAAAAEPTKDILVTPEWLTARLNDPSVVVLQVADIRLDYLREHIPGASFLWPGWLEQSTPDLSVELFPIAKMDSVLESLGVSNTSQIVLSDTYSAGSFSGVMRVWATLDYLGMGDQTKILDGGLQAWKNAGKPTTQDVPKVAKGNFTPKIKQDVFADLDYVKAHMDKTGIRLVDARRPADFKGDPKSVLPSGHIPGAVNVSYASVTDDSRRFVPADTLRARFAAAGIQPGDEIIAYCNRGVAASYVYTAAAMLGYKAHIYDGSMEEWGGRGLPVEKTPAQK
jgi:thiosulfate/3-mercaptopyruvate sulfurtransferase